MAAKYGIYYLDVCKQCGESAVKRAKTIDFDNYKTALRYAQGINARTTGHYHYVAIIEEEEK